MSTAAVKGKKHWKEELGKYLVLHDDDKAEDLAERVVDIQDQNSAPCEQRQDSPEQKTFLNEQEAESEEDQDYEFQRREVENSLETSRSKAKEMEKVCTRKRVHLRLVEYDFREENYFSEQCLKKFEEVSMDSKTLFERQGKDIQERYSTNETLNDKISSDRREPAMFQEVRPEYNRYLKILLVRPPSEWHHPLKAIDIPERQSAMVQGSEGLLSSPHTDTLVTDCQLDGDSSKYEEKLELFSSEAHQILDLVTEYTDHVLSLTRISNWLDEPLKDLMQDIETNSRKMEKDDESLTLQLNDMKDKIVNDRGRGTALKRKVQLHDSLQTQDHDVVSDALGVKITEVHRCCVDCRLTYLSTLEKLSSVEYRISLLFQFLESIPEENLETLRLIKDSERKSRLREEQLKLERERQIEMMKKCKERSLDDTKKITGRNLRPRCFPVVHKITVPEEDTIPAEEEFYAYLFTNEDE
ncbi:hypothetical protein PBY51_012612 [Eleginops maclovinus]|uniref:Coiled-coil domain-containing protein 37 n=1 Tax=Eleginops maclovinus TaxID=56733 RepID=A0AAN8AQX7_ELEMC|nr:hypothetical protein PBY51_012612 [Eleginops maclovinus]